MPAVSFELGISLGEVSKTAFELGPVPKLEDAFTWFIRCNGDEVTVHALVDGRVQQIGRAAWVRGRLIERVNMSKGFPNDHQWKLVGTALGRVMRRAFAGLAGAPTWKRALAAIDPRARPILVGAIVMGCLAIVTAAMLYRWRTREPHRPSIAQYDRLVWSDVATGGETTVALMLADPARERGRKLCVSGTIAAIERTRIDGRDVHAGTLRTLDGKSIAFVALGRATEQFRPTLCGVADGTRIVGLFDLPENKELER